MPCYAIINFNSSNPESGNQKHLLSHHKNQLAGVLMLVIGVPTVSKLRQVGLCIAIPNAKRRIGHRDRGKEPVLLSLLHPY